MKKVVYHQYGHADVLQLVDAPVPMVSEKDILVNVKAGSINPLDWKIFREKSG
jgi:NADPH:quinone reductase-like Zn-dependent oxidoreductase